MIDTITYSDNTTLLLEEVRVSCPHMILTDDNGNESIGPMTKTPTFRNGTETLAVVRGLPGELKTLQHLKEIGTVEKSGVDYVINVLPAFQAVFDQVYPRAPVTYTDNGVTYTYTPPPIFCVIA